jgi:pre-mRNA-splicing factor SYF1
MADPRRNDEYWSTWNEFEIAHGNEETFREMLRIKRSVEASFSTVNYNAAEMSGTTAQAETLSNEDAMKMIAEREGMEYDQRDANNISSTLSGFVSSKKRTVPVSNLEDVEERVAKLRKVTAGVSENKVTDNDDDNGGGDADEIELDDELDDDDDGGVDSGDKETVGESGVKNISTKAVPTAVFGGLIDKDQGGSGSAT